MYMILSTEANEIFQTKLFLSHEHLQTAIQHNYLCKHKIRNTF